MGRLTDHLSAREFIRTRDPIRAIMADQVDPPPDYCRCPDPRPVDITTLADPDEVYMCTRCGNLLKPAPPNPGRTVRH